MVLTLTLFSCWTRFRERRTHDAVSQGNPTSEYYSVTSEDDCMQRLIEKAVTLNKNIVIDAVSGFLIRIFLYIGWQKWVWWSITRNAHLLKIYKCVLLVVPD